MKNTLKHSKKAPRTRQHKGVLVSLCLIAAVVLAVGAGVFNQRTAVIQAEQEEGAATNLSSSVAQISYPEASQEETLETETTPGIGEYEKNAALVEVDSSTNIEALEAALASLGFAEAPSISNQDLDAGFVKVALDGSVSMADALDAFEAAGVQAQPNFIYHTL
jgi:hypothetical protein